jgi:hypothetical protein
MRFTLALIVCAVAACSAPKRAHETAALPKVSDPAPCQSAYQRAVADCRVQTDAPYDDCVNAAVVTLNSCLDAL